MKSKVNPRLLIVLGIALVLVVAFGAVKVLGGSDEPPLDDAASNTLDGGSGAAEEAGEAAGEPGSAADEAAIDGTPIVADESGGSSDWANRVNVICGQAAGDLLAQGATASPESAGEALDEARRVVDEIEAVAPEPGTEADAAEFISLLRSSIDSAEELVAAGEEGDLEALGAFIEEQAAVQARLLELATTLGVETCVLGPDAAQDGGVVDGNELDLTGVGGMLKLQTALLDNDSVVLVVYSPGAELDTRVVREARAGANGGGAGFVAVNGTVEAQIALLAEAFDLRETPATLVVNQDLLVLNRFDGFADRETVAQAVRDSLGAS